MNELISITLSIENTKISRTPRNQTILELSGDIILDLTEEEHDELRRAVFDGGCRLRWFRAKGGAA